MTIWTIIAIWCVANVGFVVATARARRTRIRDRAARSTASLTDPLS